MLIGIQISNFKNLCSSVGLEYSIGTIRQVVSNVIIVGSESVHVSLNDLNGSQQFKPLA